MSYDYGGLDLQYTSTAAAIVQYSIVEGSGNAQTVLAAADATAASPLFGISQDAVTSAGGTVTVRVSGTSKVKLAGTVYPGDFLTATTAGAAVATTTGGQAIIGKALQYGVSGDIVCCTVNPGSI